MIGFRQLLEYMDEIQLDETEAIRLFSLLHHNRQIPIQDAIFFDFKENHFSK